MHTNGNHVRKQITEKRKKSRKAILRNVDDPSPKHHTPASPISDFVLQHKRTGEFGINATTVLPADFSEVGKLADGDY